MTKNNIERKVPEKTKLESNTNTCGICRSQGLLGCRCRKGAGESSSSGEGVSEIKNVSNAVSLPTNPPHPIDTLSLLDQTSGWTRSNVFDPSFKFERPDALFTMELDGRDSIIFSGKNDLSADQLIALGQYLEAIKEELIDYKKDLLENGIKSELLDQMKVGLENNGLTMKFPSPEYYNAFVQRTIDKNLFPTSPSPHITKLSEEASFSVEDIPNENSKKNITFVYKDPEKKLDSLMLVVGLYSRSHAHDEIPMTYNDDKKQWTASLVTPYDTTERFRMIHNRVPTDYSTLSENAIQSALNLTAEADFKEDGYIALKGGIQQPGINQNPDVPKGLVKTYLYTESGEILEPVEEKDLKKGDRFIIVYLPPDYENHAPQRDPPFNLQIGLDGTPGEMTIMGKADILDNLIAAKKIEPVVAVFVPPWHGPSVPVLAPQNAPLGYPSIMRFDEYGCNPDVAKNLAITLPKAMRARFGDITTDPEHMVIMGTSLGGEQAIFTALSQPGVFGKVIAQSPSLHWSKGADSMDDTEQSQLPRMLTNGDFGETPENPPTFWVESGRTEHEPLRAAVEKFVPELKDNGYPVKYHEYNGGHDYAHWRSGLVEALIYMQPLSPAVNATEKNTQNLTQAKINEVMQPQQIKLPPILPANIREFNSSPPAKDPVKHNQLPPLTKEKNIGFKSKYQAIIDNRPHTADTEKTENDVVPSKIRPNTR